MKAAGTDATKQFDAFHNANVLQKLGVKYEIGHVGVPMDQEDKATNEEIQEQQEEAEEDNSNPLVVEETFGDMVPFGDPMWYQDWYSPYYNDTHREVRKQVRAFVEKEIMPFTHEWDENKEMPREIYQKAAKVGILAAVVGHVEDQYCPYGLPAGIKAENFDSFHHLIVADELSRCASGGVSF